MVYRMFFLVRNFVSFCTLKP